MAICVNCSEEIGVEVRPITTCYLFNHRILRKYEEIAKECGLIE